MKAKETEISAALWALRLGKDFTFFTALCYTEAIRNSVLVYICVCGVGPRLFLSCPMNTIEAHSWFTDLWNYSIVPYLLEAQV